MYPPKIYILAIMLLAGVGLSYLGFQDLLWMGSQWLSSKANYPWAFNTYLSVPGKTSFLYLGLISLWVGGLCAGIAVVLIMAKFSKTSLLPFFLSIFFTGLGFNTLDWMLGSVYGLGSLPLWPLHLSSNMESWNWYILLGIFPCFLGGVLICLPVTFAALKSMGKL
jgi:hypothetical protein